MTDHKHVKTALHIYPVRDLREHRVDNTVECWCGPRVEVADGGLVIVHKAEDGRDLIERYGIQ